MSAVVRGRRDELRELLRTRELPAALVTASANVRYLTGFTGSNGAVLVTVSGSDVFATDGRYEEQAGQECPDLELIVDRKLLPRLGERALALAADVVGVETHHLTLDQRDQLGEAVPGLAIESLQRAVEELRRTKDETELAALRTACAVSCQALEDLFDSGLAGRTEREVARDLERRMAEHGADAAGFATIVASGPHSAVPHHQPTQRRIGRGDFVKIDFGARYAGYHADCTRTVVIGPPAAWQEEVYAVVAQAQAAGRAALAPGTELAAVDAAARSIIEAAGYGDRFPHGLGHGVGLEIHEDPFFAKEAGGRLDDRCTVTVEPGIYLPGRGGVRLEDTLAVGSGEPEPLTTTTRTLLALD